RLEGEATVVVEALDMRRERHVALARERELDLARRRARVDDDASAQCALRRDHEHDVARALLDLHLRRTQVPQLREYLEPAVRERAADLELPVDIGVGDRDRLSGEVR